MEYSWIFAKIKLKPFSSGLIKKKKNKILNIPVSKNLMDRKTPSHRFEEDHHIPSLCGDIFGNFWCCFDCYGLFHTLNFLRCSHWQSKSWLQTFKGFSFPTSPLAEQIHNSPFPTGIQSQWSGERNSRWREHPIPLIKPDFKKSGIAENEGIG